MSVRRGDVSGLPAVVGVPAKKEKRRSLYLSGETHRGIPIEHLPNCIPPKEGTGNTSQAWARERAERSQATGVSGKATGIPEHKLPGGETTTRAKLKAAAEAQNERELVALTAELRREEEQKAAREVDLVERATQPLKKPKKRRKRPRRR